MWFFFDNTVDYKFTDYFVKILYNFQIIALQYMIISTEEQYYFYYFYYLMKNP